MLGPSSEAALGSCRRLLPPHAQALLRQANHLKSRLISAAHNKSSSSTHQIHTGPISCRAHSTAVVHGALNTRRHSVFTTCRAVATTSAPQTGRTGRRSASAFAASSPPPQVLPEYGHDASDHRQRGSSPWSKSRIYQKQNKSIIAARTGPRLLRRTPTDAHLQTELKYLNDPFKLAQHILYVLQTGNEQKALALVRLSSRNLANTVSWNHVVDWQMKQGKTSVAIDTYNEMKKRGLEPDSHTYLILLRGLSFHAHLSNSLGKALSIYHSMSGPKTRVPPTIMHTNAILRVCSRAMDLDSMWDIVSKLPDRGPQSPNAWTYTTLLNTLRLNALANAPFGETADDLARRREEAVVEGRQLWHLIVRRWRAGDVALDEELVASMGRLLLVGARPRDWDDVLSLLQQSMNLPRLVPRLGSAARAEDSAVPIIRAPATPADMKNDVADTPQHEHDEPRAGSEFDTFITGASGSGQSRAQAMASSRRNSHVYAIPSNSVLSLVLETCLKMATTSTAVDYWNLLINSDKYAVRPDLDNANMLLRVHRQARSWEASLSVVTDDFPRWSLEPQPKAFRLAMTACTRDTRNAALALDAAGKLLDVASNRLQDPDLRCMCLYAELAGRSGDSRLIGRAMERLEGQLGRVRSFLVLGGKSNGGVISQTEKEDGVLLGRAMISCCDKVLELRPGRGGLESQEEKAKWTHRRSLTAGWVTNMNKEEERRRRRNKFEAEQREHESIAGAKMQGIRAR